MVICIFAYEIHKWEKVCNRKKWSFVTTNFGEIDLFFVLCSISIIVELTVFIGRTNDFFVDLFFVSRSNKKTKLLVRG